MMTEISNPGKRYSFDELDLCPISPKVMKLDLESQLLDNGLGNESCIGRYTLENDQLTTGDFGSFFSVNKSQDSLLNSVATNQEFPSMHPIFDDWDDLNYDTDDDDDFDFLNNLTSSSVKSPDNLSTHGSEGYGTDTSENGDLLAQAIETLLPKETSLIEETNELVNTPILSPQSAATPTQPAPKTVNLVIPETFPNLAFQANSLIQPKKPTSLIKVVKSSPLTKCEPVKVLTFPKPTEPQKLTKITKFYQVPKLEKNTTSSARVETKLRKTVVVRVIRPTKGCIKIKRTNPNMTSRAYQKMQLQRERDLQEQRRKAKAQKSVADAVSKNSTSAINFPTFQVSTPQLPAQILKVETGLQNPTRYHVQETQRHQVRDYLSRSSGTGSKYVVHNFLNPPSSAPAAGNLDGLSAGSTPASPLARLNLSGGEHMNDIIDDIVSLESSYGDESSGFSHAATLTGVSPSNKLSLTQLPVVIQGQTSSSCPLIKREYTDEDTRIYVKDRIKKDNHNIIERRRRYNINDRIRELGHMVPKSLDPDMRWNKGSILKAAVDYIQLLQNEQNRTKQVEQRAKQMETMNKQLLLKVQNMEMLLQQNGINIPTNTNEKQTMVNTLLNFSPNSEVSFTKEEEFQVSKFPTSPVQNQISHSPLAPSTSLPGPDIMSMQVVGENSPVRFVCSPNPMQQQTVVKNEQLLTVDVDQISDQHVSNQSLSDAQSFTAHLVDTPLTIDSNPTITSPLQQQQQQHQHHQDNMSNLDLGLDGMDMTSFNFDTPVTADLSNLIGEGGFSALLNNEQPQFDDVAMEDFSSLIKTDMFLSDANNTFPNNNTNS